MATQPCIVCILNGYDRDLTGREFSSFSLKEHSANLQPGSSLLLSAKQSAYFVIKSSKGFANLGFVIASPSLRPKSENERSHGRLSSGFVTVPVMSVTSVGIIVIGFVPLTARWCGPKPSTVRGVHMR